jgi:hypothetical protein
LVRRLACSVADSASGRRERGICRLEAGAGVGNREDEPEGIEKLKTNHHGQATARRAAVAKKQTVHDQIQNMGERLRAPTVGVVLRRRVRSGGGRKRSVGRAHSEGRNPVAPPLCHTTPITFVLLGGCDTRVQCACNGTTLSAPPARGQTQ